MNWLALSGAITLIGSTLFAQGEQGPPIDPDAGSEPQATSSAAEQDPLVAILAMEAERNARMTVPVTIMGQGPFRFMVDTGAQATVLSSSLAAQLELHDRQDATLVGMASRRAVQTTMVPDFSLGDRTFTIRTAPIIDGRHIGRADGILGLDSLQNQRVLLDFENDEMHISDSFSGGGSRSYDIIVRARERFGQLIIHRAQIDGITTAVVVDTGAESSIGNMALQDRMRRRRVEQADTVLTDVNGIEILGDTKIARNMDLGNVRLTNIPITFADAPTFGELNLDDRPAMILGMSELRMFSRVAIDFRSRRILFDLPDGLTRDQSWNFNQRASRLRQ